uniref:Uncharacterized protein n=1 Tax=Glossina brevipalpis TaxID=37001 RepID=A0A1A9WH70_9MUSC
MQEQQQQQKIKLAIDLIVQHIRDFLNNRSGHGSTSNIQVFMNLEPEAQELGVLNYERHHHRHRSLRRFSALSHELTIQSNVFFEKNKNLTQH